MKALHELLNMLRFGLVQLNLSPQTLGLGEEHLIFRMLFGEKLCDLHAAKQDEIGSQRDGAEADSAFFSWSQRAHG